MYPCIVVPIVVVDQVLYQVEEDVGSVTVCIRISETTTLTMPATVFVATSDNTAQGTVV